MRYIPCEKCKGTGEVEKDGRGVGGNICPECEGTGEVEIKSSDIFDFAKELSRDLDAGTKAIACGRVWEVEK